MTALGKMNDQRTMAVLPRETIFPATSQALIRQAKIFTGKEIVMDPHWKAAPSLWLSEGNRDIYREWLKEVEKSVERRYAAFVFSREDLGAYIVYADHGKKWDGSLSSTYPEDEEKADSLTHEIGHLITDVPGEQLSAPVNRFFREQAAILAGSLLKTTIGNTWRSNRTFPMLKAYQPPYLQQDMPFENFSVYTPSPLALFYETERGRREGKEKFLSESGIIRFDLIADEVSRAARHMRHHLNALLMFGDIAGQMAKNSRYAEDIAASMPDFGTIRLLKRNAPRDEYAATILKHWWAAARDVLGEQKDLAPKNIYAGEDEEIQSVHHAESYFLNLAAAAQMASVRKPEDRLLRVVSDGLSKMLNKPGNQPQITSAIIVRSPPEVRKVEPTRKTSRTGVVGWVKEHLFQTTEGRHVK